MGCEAEDAENSCDSDDGEEASNGLGRIFYLWALEIRFPHPVQAALKSAEDSKSGGAPCTNTAQSREIKVNVRGSELEEFRQFHFGLGEHPKKKPKKKVKASNV